MSKARTRTSLDLVAGTYALVVPLAFSTALTAPSWTFRYALLIALTPFLLVTAPRILRSEGRHPLIAGVVLLVSAGVSASLSSNPYLSVIGDYLGSTAWLVIAGAVSAWSLGRCLSSQGKSDVARALLIGGLVNAATAILQVLLPLERWGLSLFDDRSAGLYGNPVHLATILTGCLALAESDFRRRPVRWAAAPLVLGAALQLTGSRFVLLMAVPAAIVYLLAKRDAIAVLFLLALSVGAMSVVMTPSLRSERRAFERLSATEGVGGGSTTTRVEGWVSGLRAAADRPVFGHGPGRYLEASTSHRPFELGSLGPDTYFADAHNPFVEYAVTLGLAGVLVGAVFLTLSARSCSGPLLGFAVGVGVLHLVQPQHVGTTPLALLALGASARATMAGVERTRRSLAIVWAVATTGAATFAATLVIGDMTLKKGVLEYSIATASRGDRMLPSWPEPLKAIAKMQTFRAVAERRPEDDEIDLDKFEEAVKSMRASAARDPADPRHWNDVGQYAARAGHHDEALKAFSRAIDGNEWTLIGRLGRARSALALGDGRTALADLAVARRLRPDSTEIAELITSVEQRP